MIEKLFLIIVAALVGGAIGFGIAVSVVPLDEIAQFHALIGAGLGAISSAHHPENADIGVEHREASQSKEPARQPATGTAPPNDIPARDRVAPNMRSNEIGDKLQAPAVRQPALDVPASAPQAFDAKKAPAAPGGRSKRSEKKEPRL